MHGRLTPLVLLAASAVLISAPPARGLSLGISLPTAVTLPGLAPGSTSTAAPFTVAVVSALGPWTLTVDDANRSLGTAGRMRAGQTSACQGSAPALANPLHLATVALGTNATVDRSSYDLGTLANAQIAHGSALLVSTNAVSVTVSQSVGAMEQLTGGCTYSVTLTWTIG